MNWKIRILAWAEEQIGRELESYGFSFPGDRETFFAKIKKKLKLSFARLILNLGYSKDQPNVLGMVLDRLSPRRKISIPKLLLFIGGGVLIAFICWGIYLSSVKGYGWADWTGFGEYLGPLAEDQRGKTLWDWMELLVIPVVLAVGAYLFSRSENNRRNKIEEQRIVAERELNTERHREAVLQSYFDKMSELLLKNKLRSTNSNEARQIARALIVTTLEQLDGRRKGILLRFLKDAELIQAQNPVVNLERANFTHLYLYDVSLERVNLVKADFRFSELSHVNLAGSKLDRILFSGSTLKEIDFSGASLRSVDFSRAELTGITMDKADIRDVSFVGFGHIRSLEDIFTGPVSASFRSVSLQGAVYNIGTMWPENFDIESSGAVPHSNIYDFDIPEF